MTEHEKLKVICDKIGYKSNTYKTCNPCEIENIDLQWTEVDINEINWVDVEKNVREIIFTQEFMDKYIDYVCDNRWHWIAEWVLQYIGQHLNDPVDYLYNLIK